MRWLPLAALLALALNGANGDGPAPTSKPRPNGPAKAKPVDEEGIGAQARNEARARARRRTRAAPRGKTPPPLGLDGARLPVSGGPTVQRLPVDGATSALTGWAATLDAPEFDDRRRRPHTSPTPPPWTDLLQPGEGFRFDVYFGGNPAGHAEARVMERTADPRGASPHGADTLRLWGKASTAGIFGLLAQVTDEMVAVIDAETGASVDNNNEVNATGVFAKYAHRETTTQYEGRGFVRVTDVKDGKRRLVVKRVPEDTVDPLTIMAWVRTLDLAEGERAVAHTLDATALLRVEAVGRGLRRPDKLPTIATALEVSPDNIRLIEGRMVRVDRYDEPIPGRREISFRAYVSADERALPVVMETDLWMGVIRLLLAGYDPPMGPPSPSAPAPAPADRAD